MQDIHNLVLQYPINLIDDDFFFEHIKLNSLQDNFLPNNLSKVFLNYYIHFETNKFLYEKKQNNKNEDFTCVPPERFKKINGKEPWVLVNEILNEYSCLTYRVNNPKEEDRNLGYVFGSNPKHFQVKLKDPNNGLVINFNDLSSGERVLMALVASLYNLNHPPL